jgi:excisionase family DNA binding protein
MPQVPNPILTLRELSAYIRVPASSLYKLVRSGGIPGRKVGKTWRFHRASIERWLAGGGAGTSGKKKNKTGKREKRPTRGIK